MSFLSFVFFSTGEKNTKKKLEVLTLYMLWTSCRHPVWESSPDQSVFASVETFRTKEFVRTIHCNMVAERLC